MNEASDANGYIWGSAVQTQGCTVSLQIVEADSFLAVGVLRCLRVCASVRVCARVLCTWVSSCCPLTAPQQEASGYQGGEGNFHQGVTDLVVKYSLR